MIVSPRSCHLLKLCAIVLAIISTFYFLFADDSRDYHEVYRVVVSGKKAIWVEKALQTDIDGPFDGTAIQQLCNSRKWNEGLIFKCDASARGVANVRNVVLNCIRLCNGSWRFVPSPWFHFLPTDVASHSCIRHSRTRGSRHRHCGPPRRQSGPLLPFLRPRTLHQRDVHLLPPDAPLLPHKRPLRRPLNRQSPFNRPTRACHFLHSRRRARRTKKPGSQPFTPGSIPLPKPTLPANQFSPVNGLSSSPLRTPLLQLPLSYDDPKFVAMFGRLVQPPLVVRTLASTVLYSMSLTYNLNIDPTATGIAPGLFYGAHLRTADDANDVGWPPYSVQSHNYLLGASTSSPPLRLIYLTTGSPEDAATFYTTAFQNFSIQTTAKDALLRGKGFEQERADLASLTWDQQRLVDYEVLLRGKRIWRHRKE